MVQTMSSTSEYPQAGTCSKLGVKSMVSCVYKKIKLIVSNVYKEIKMMVSNVYRKIKQMVRQVNKEIRLMVSKDIKAQHKLMASYIWMVKDIRLMTSCGGKGTSKEMAINLFK